LRKRLLGSKEPLASGSCKPLTLRLAPSARDLPLLVAEGGMNEDRTLGRREFTLAAAMLALSGATITISACGGGGGSSPSAPTQPAPSSDKVGVISSNHGHSAVITAAQLTAGGALSLDIRGQSDHPHTVVLTAGQIASIASNQRVSQESTTNDGHSHTVTFN
jgi:hypothetical protein